MRGILLLISAIFLASCGSDLPMALSSADAAGKAFVSPPTNRAALYVFRTEKAGTTFSIELDQRKLGLLGRASWLRVDVPSVAADLRCSSPVMRDAPAVLPVALAPGSITFVMVSYIPMGDPSCRLQIVSEDFGRLEVLAGSRIREVGGASD